MTAISRRTFLKTGALASAGAYLSARSYAQVAGASGDIRIAVIGLNGRGKNHLSEFNRIKGVRVAALCDVDSAVLAKAAAGQASGTKTYTDIRKLLDDREIDAVSIATPNHWHSLAAIWAIQAGKDVYVEKPVCHNVWEGRQLVNAAKKSDRVVQAGTQCRSNPGITDALAWLQQGHLGKVTLSCGLCYKRRESIGRVAATPPVPRTVNFDLWAGPAPLVPPHRKRFHYDWHWFWETGNGDSCNQGIHQMDLARLFLGEPGLAPHTLSVGGRLGYLDDGQTPNTQVIVHDYASAPLVFEVRGLPSHGHADLVSAAAGAGGASSDQGAMDLYPPSAKDNKHGVNVGNVVECEGGRLVIPSYSTAFAYDRSGKLIKSFSGIGNHFKNFTDVVRSRKISDLKGPIEDGHISSSLCHTGNISHRVGTRMAPGEIADMVKSNPVMAECYGRMAEHLARNQVPLDRTPPTLGVPLVLDPAAEKFVGNDQANQLISREYRAPYTVPQIGA
jgi:predicted dehydrogenase